MSIPKIVHLSWNDKFVLNNSHPLITNGIGNFKKLNPEWDILIYDDNDIEIYLKHHLLETDYNLIKNFHIVSKTDLWRLFKIYYEGGLYIDIDRLINIPICKIIDNNTRWVLPICNYKDFSQDIMCSSPLNPVFKNTINLYLQRIRNNITHVYFLGPQTYMHGVTFTLFNHIIDSDPGEEIFKQIEEKINNFTFIKTFNEYPPCNTIFYNGSILPEDWVKLKQSFYLENNLNHWSGEW